MKVAIVKVSTCIPTFYNIKGQMRKSHLQPFSENFNEQVLGKNATDQSFLPGNGCGNTQSAGDGSC